MMRFCRFPTSCQVHDEPRTWALLHGFACAIIKLPEASPSLATLASLDLVSHHHLLVSCTGTTSKEH